MIMFEVIIYCIIILGFICCVIWAYQKEKKDWNGGRCPKCGAKLTKILNDNKGYMCESCRDYWVWFTIFEPKEK